jgi:hypothetical protein
MASKFAKGASMTLKNISMQQKLIWLSKIEEIEICWKSCKNGLQKKLLLISLKKQDLCDLLWRSLPRLRLSSG